MSEPTLYQIDRTQANPTDEDLWQHLIGRGVLVPVEPDVFWRLDFAAAEQQGNGEKMNQMVDLLIDWGWLDSVVAVPVAGIGDNDER